MQEGKPPLGRSGCRCATGQLRDHVGPLSRSHLTGAQIHSAARRPDQHLVVVEVVGPCNAVLVGAGERFNSGNGVLAAQGAGLLCGPPAEPVGLFLAVCRLDLIGLRCRPGVQLNRAGAQIEARPGHVFKPVIDFPAGASPEQPLAPQCDMARVLVPASRAKVRRKRIM